MSYAILRADLQMPPGKAAAQAGHAFCASLLDALHADPALALRLAHPITRIVLSAPRLIDLERACARAREAGLACALFTDSGHVLPPSFDGTPVVTALGIGPCRKAAARSITRRFRCLP